MGQAGKKGVLFIFILFLPKWTKINANSDKIEKQLASNNFFTNAKAAQPSSSNQALAKPSALS